MRVKAALVCAYLKADMKHSTRVSCNMQLQSVALLGHLSHMGPDMSGVLFLQSWTRPHGFDKSNPALLRWPRDRRSKQRWNAYLALTLSRRRWHMARCWNASSLEKNLASRCFFERVDVCEDIFYMCQGLNSHYFHIIGDGHQSNSRGLYTHYKDSY